MHDTTPDDPRTGYESSPSTGHREIAAIIQAAGTCNLDASLAYDHVKDAPATGPLVEHTGGLFPELALAGGKNPDTDAPEGDSSDETPTPGAGKTTSATDPDAASERVAHA